MIEDKYDDDFEDFEQSKPAPVTTKPATTTAVGSRGANANQNLPSDEMSNDFEEISDHYEF